MVISSPCNTNSLWFRVITDISATQQCTTSCLLRFFLRHPAARSASQRVSWNWCQRRVRRAISGQSSFTRLTRGQSHWSHWSWWLKHTSYLHLFALNDAGQLSATMCNLQINHSHEGWCNELIVSAEAQDDRPSGGHNQQKNHAKDRSEEEKKLKL